MIDANALGMLKDKKVPKEAPKVIKDCFTERDNNTWDLNRILFFIAVVTFIGIAFWAIVINKQAFEWLEAGGGMAAVLGGGGAQLALNRKNQNGE